MSERNAHEPAELREQAAAIAATLERVQRELAQLAECVDALDGHRTDVGGAS